MAVQEHSDFAQLSAEDLEAIREATRQAERRTGGELVCVLVRRCDGYPGSHWKGATLGAVAGAAAGAVAQSLDSGWGGLPPYLLPLLVLAGAAAGLAAVVVLPILRRMLVPTELLDQRVDRRAAAAFLEEEVFATRDRTGILLFVAFFEHRVRILADRGIHERVDPAVWESIAGELTRGLRAGHARDALIAAVEACGKALEEHRVGRRPDDVNELRDQPRLRDD